ncbi:MAG: peptide deformylase [Gammaproteobacteria bacterium]|nr:peptide deformylase [Gammaproteobacteria bacterium]NND40257.1 peptide deformylase [Pseudomonadales bacterium]MBT8150143.1 peptide deformylase [Gammaproteobacteria bacterium]NNL10973.1 peptide deformylase [Pseudomonadales bacterium]NNM11240.1 peptide deformylase [Pseudomonadales bacterium]
MAILEILEFPDPQLRTIAKPVEGVDDSVRQLVDDMIETMYEAEGVGLAATQVNVHKRVIVLDVSEGRDQAQVFINPKIKVIDETPHSYQEGCLSVPGFYEEVERPTAVKVAALDRHGEQFIIEPDGLLSVCIQHEIDHLNGKLFVDYISALKRNRIKQKLQKEKRLA